MLRPELERVKGFVENIRYKRLSRQGWILSLSNWDDEKALVRRRTQAKHHGVQEKGREEVLLDHHLRVGQLTRDTRPPEEHALREQRLDETETGEGTTVVLIDARRPKEWIEKSCHEDVARSLGFVQETPGRASWDVFDSVLTPGDAIVPSAWRDHGSAEAFEAAAKLPEGARLHRVRVVRDCGMFDRRESPQCYPRAIAP